MTHPAYRRSQILWLLWGVLPATAVLTLVLAWPHQVDRAGLWAVAALAVAPLVLLLGLGRFQLVVDQTSVAWRFGFVGWPHWRLPLTDIRQVEVARSSWVEGWGIRRTKEGMLYNARGHGAVRLTLKDGRRLRLGSDEPDRLAACIQARLS